MYPNESYQVEKSVNKAKKSNKGLNSAIKEIIFLLYKKYTAILQSYIELFSTCKTSTLP